MLERLRNYIRNNRADLFYTLLRALVVVLVFSFSDRISAFATGVAKWVVEVVPWTILRAFAEEYGIALPVLVLGTILYTIRCRLPRFYGVSEIVVGVVAAYYLYNDVLPRAQDRWTVSISIAGAVYIIVRGYDNWYRGITRKKPWNWLFFGKAEEGKLGG
jgi:hypothetical protein